jgi:hypothetical protein
MQLSQMVVGLLQFFRLPMINTRFFFVKLCGENFQNLKIGGFFISINRIDTLTLIQVFPPREKYTMRSIQNEWTKGLNFKKKIEINMFLINPSILNMFCLK